MAAKAIDSYHCDICGHYYNGDSDTIYSDEKWTKCYHTDKRINKEAYERHMEELTFPHVLTG